MSFVRLKRDGLAGALALAIAGVVATEAKAWVESLDPALTTGWHWILTAIGILAISAFIAFFFLRWSLRILGAASLILFLPKRVAERLPSLFAASSPEEANDTILDSATRRVLETLLRPAFAGIGLTIEDLRAQPSVVTALDESIRSMTDRWLPGNLFDPPPDVSLKYLDPIHGTIAFGREFTWLLTHPLMQRLNEIRQLVFAFPRYPGGTHTRFNHSIGVAHLARAAVKRVLDAG